MLILSDRVKETSVTSGSGSVILSGAFRGFQSFLNGIGNGNSTYYTIENGRNFEVGIGVYNSGTNSLSRNVILESTNNDQLINLADNSIVFCTYPASRSVFLNEAGYISGQSPHYSGIAFPDGTIQTSVAKLNGSGVSNNLAYWLDQNNIDNLSNLQWNPSNNLLSLSGNLYCSNNLEIDGAIDVDKSSIFRGTSNIFTGHVNVSGLLTSVNSNLTSGTLKDTVFYRLSEGCFFHAYVDNAYDNMVALHSTNEANPTWRLGIKSYSSSFTTSPSLGYVQGKNGEAGIFATSQNSAAITYVNGFWVTHSNINLFNIDIDQGVRILNSKAAVVPLNVRGASAQSANLQEWESYTSTVVASMNSSGQISINSIKFPDNTVQSTAYVPSSESYRTINSNTTLLSSDSIIFVDCSIANVAITLSTAVGVGGKRYTIKRKAGGLFSLTIIPSGSQKIDSANNFVMPQDNQSITLVSDNSNWFII